MFVFQFIDQKKTGPAIQTMQELSGAHDIATSYYLASEPSTLQSYLLKFNLDVQPQYAGRCATTLNVQSPSGTSFIFEQQGYFASAGSINIQFSHTGALREGEMIQLGGMELHVDKVEGFPKKWTLSNGRSQFVLSDNGHLLEINFDPKRQYSEAERKYWAPVMCDDGMERPGIELPYSVSIRSENGKDVAVITPEPSTGIYGMWAEGQGANLPFGINLSFPGHKEDEIDHVKMEVVDNPFKSISSSPKVIRISSDPSRNLQFQPNESGDSLSELFYFPDGGSLPQHKYFFYGDGSSEPKCTMFFSITRQDYYLNLPTYVCGIDGGHTPILSDGHLLLGFGWSSVMAFDGEMTHDSSTGSYSFQNLKISGEDPIKVMGAPTVSSTGEYIYPTLFRSLHDATFDQFGDRYIIDMTASNCVKMQVFNQSKSQFHWQAGNPFQSYSPWDNNASESLGISRNNNLQLLKAYPNPANDKVTIQYDNPALSGAAIELSVSNPLGQRLFARYLAPGQVAAETIDLRAQPSGVYFVNARKITFDGKYHTSYYKDESLKFVVKH